MELLEERYMALLARYGRGEEDLGSSVADLADVGPATSIAMVERARDTAHHWVTLHATPDDAAQYHINQEYAEEWTVVTVEDLSTGLCYQIEITARAVLMEGD